MISKHALPLIFHRPAIEPRRRPKRVTCAKFNTASIYLSNPKTKRSEFFSCVKLGCQTLRALSTRRASVSHSLIRAAPIPIYYSNSTITPGHRNEAHGLVAPHGPLRERVGDADLGRRHRGHARRGGARGGGDGVRRLPPANLPPSSPPMTKAKC